jgi:aminoglycoside phosphotransferase (APT) family kinase protein
VIDVDRLAAWMDGVGLAGKGEQIDARYVSGGSQNEIYEIRRGELHGAVRIPPPTAPANRDEGILREWRIIEALDGTDVPCTPALGVCPDTSVLGRAFYIMGFVEGWSPMSTDGWPPPFNSDLQARQGLAYQLAEGIALLGNVDWKARGLHDLGRPDGFHERQVDRWTAFLERIKGRELPGFDVAAAWLRAHRPIDYLPGLMHGDYQFANVMFEHGAPARLAAIVDWEMGTVGDPKLDLGWVVHRWRPGPRAWGTPTSTACRPVPRSSSATPRRPAARSTTSTTTSCSPNGSSGSCWNRATSGPATTRSSRCSGPSCSSS